MNGMEKEKIADLLLEAQRTAVPLPLHLRQSFTLDEAYEVQKCVVEKKLAQGHRILGKKIGLTSKAMRDAMGIDRPDFGSIFSDGIYPQGIPLKRDAFITPRVEGEIAFLLKEDIKAANCTVYDVIKATEGVMACLEFVDSRWGKDFSFYDSVSDNASCGGFMLGSKLVSLTDLDLRYIGLYMTKNGALINSGLGVEVMGDPLNAVVWLANQMIERGDYLKAGDIILSGSLVAAVPVEKGDSMNICFSQLGNIEIKFE